MDNGNTESSPHVLFLAAEAEPFIKVGGLGDVAGALPQAIKQARPDIDIRLAIPYYGSLNLDSPVKPVTDFVLPTSIGPETVRVFQTELGAVPVYLIAGDSIFPERPVYGTDFSLDAEKFIFFSLACLFLPEHIDWQIDVLHANDWHTAVALHKLALLSIKDERYKKIKSILTVHNLPYMGSQTESALEKFLIPPADNPALPPWARSLPLPMGLSAADMIVAVSPTYSREIMQPGFGCDLQDFLKTRNSKISGILNGIDYSIWDPSTDLLIVRQFSMASLSSRSENKRALQSELGLELESRTPLLASIGRIDEQKGIDLMIDSVKKHWNSDWQLVVLGTGSSTLESRLHDFQKGFPDKVRFANKFDLSLSHRIYAGADMLLMPSRYEPCGLAQMIAMRYGCIPVAAATGGLKDSIIDFNKKPASATGFLSSGGSAVSFSAQIGQAIHTFSNRSVWEKMQKNAMSMDFSWSQSAGKYIQLYEK